jgi:hypothetical protein
MLHAAIELVQTNGHSCTFEGDLTPAKPAGASEQRWIYDRADDGEEGPCHVEMIHKNPEIEIHSQGCLYYCGARAHLEASFTVASRER